MPWTPGVTQVALRFSEDVGAPLAQDELVVRGSISAPAALSAVT